jgi:hypothetical protein
LFVSGVVLVNSVRTLLTSPKLSTRFQEIS